MIIKLLRLFFMTYLMGFVCPHRYLTSGQFKTLQGLLVDTSGELPVRFEHDLAVRLGASPENVISVAAGRMGFYMALRAFGVGEGDEVLLTGFTCAVMVNAVLRVGAEPVYADISEGTLGTDPQSVAARITQNTRLIVAQHSFGLPCDVPRIMAVANGIPVVEDCAISFGSTLNGRALGTFGDAAIYSFDHSKPVNALIGGAVLFVIETGLIRCVIGGRTLMKYLWKSAGCS